MSKQLQNEGKLLLAYHAIQNDSNLSIRAAARLYSVSEATLRRRVHGRVGRADYRPVGHKLTITEEETLRAWLIDMDDRGYPLTPANLQSAANLLLQARTNSTDCVGQNWPSRFIKRQPDLQTRYNRKYDYQRAKCEDPVLLQQWFNLIHNTIIKYGIITDDIYNFDETGFAMGIASTSQVITSSDRRQKPHLIQQGDREWATVIEAISAKGFILPPMVILKGKVHLQSWYEYRQLPSDWVISLSPKGWTSNELGLEWLTTIFEPVTRARAVGAYRLLILDGHESHATPQFDQYCKDHSIITLCMPPHSSHILQPLDVGCFAPLKKAYGNQVGNLMRLGINHIDKPEFLTCLENARIEAFSVSNIHSGFAATGVVPFDPERVLSMFSRPITPPFVPTAHPQRYSPQTPHNLAELQQHVGAIQELLRRLSRSPPTPTNRAIQQLVKGCERSMQGAVLLIADNQRLRAANERQTKKRLIKRRHISKATSLTIAQASILIQQSPNPINTPAIVVEAEASISRETPTLAATPQITCYICRGYDHEARECTKYRIVH
jgi:hypothetical protein